MAKDREIKQLRLDKNKSDDDSKKRKKKESEDFGGRKLILVLFVVSILLSLVFWLQGNFSDWFGDFFGPSTWTFSR